MSQGSQVFLDVTWKGIFPCSFPFRVNYHGFLNVKVFVKNSKA